MKMTIRKNEYGGYQVSDGYITKIVGDWLATALVGRELRPEEVAELDVRPNIRGPRYEVWKCGDVMQVRHRRSGFVERSWAGDYAYETCGECGNRKAAGYGFTEEQEDAAAELCEHLNRTYYKVVHVEDGESMWSMSAARLPYGVGVRTKPFEGTGLLAFETLEQARRFIEVNCFAFAKILRGYGAPGPELPDLRLGNTFTSWNAKVAWRETWRGGYEWPEGTVSLAWFEGEEVVA